MSKKGGEILNDLWKRVDQADYDMMIVEAFDSLPTGRQKAFIQDIIRGDSWDLNGKPDEETLKAYREFCGMNDDG